MKLRQFFIFLTFAMPFNLKAEQLVDIRTVEELKLAYGKSLNVYVSGKSPFYLMGELNKANLLQACADNGYYCTERGNRIELNRAEPSSREVLSTPIDTLPPTVHVARSIKNKPESFENVSGVTPAAGKLIYSQDNPLSHSITSATFIKPTIYIYSRTNNDRKVSLFDELITSLSPFTLSRKMGLPVDFLFNHKNIADFLDSRTGSFYYSKTFISCVTGDYCEVLNESRYEYDETVRTQISESSSKRFDIVTQGFKLRFREQAVDLSVSFCEDRYNCLRFEQVSERKIGECYQLFFKTDIKVNSRHVFGETKNTKVNNLGFVICEK